MSVSKNFAYSVYEYYSVPASGIEKSFPKLYSHEINAWTGSDGVTESYLSHQNIFEGSEK